MSFSSATLLILVCSSLLAPCSDDSPPRDAGPTDAPTRDASDATPHDATPDVGDADPVLACPDTYYARQRDQIRGATPSPDGLGWCCPPTDTPSCNCTPTGGFVAERCECGRDYGVCDGHPKHWRRGTDAHGCDRWYVGMTYICNPPPPPEDEDAGTAPDPRD
jgi:hypothetical protein